MKESKIAKLEFGDLLGIGMTLVVTVIGIAMGASVTGDIRTSVATDDCVKLGDGHRWNATAEVCSNDTTSVTVRSLDYNVSTNGLSGITNLSVRIPTIMTVIVIAIIIGVLVRHLVFRYS